MIIDDAVPRASRTDQGTDYQLASLMIVSVFHPSSHSICIIKIFLLNDQSCFKLDRFNLAPASAQDSTINEVQSLPYHLSEKSSKISFACYQVEQNSSLG